MSCKKAQKFFEQHGVEVETSVDPRKEPIDSDGAWQRILAAKRVAVAKGTVLKDLLVCERNREEILASVVGPSGKLRAPTFKVDDYYVVGFNEEMYVTALQE